MVDEVYFQSTKPRPLQSIERSTESLYSIHSDLRDLKSIQTKCGNKYYIIFVHDSPKHYYVNIPKSKGELIERFVFYKN